MIPSLQFHIHSRLINIILWPILILAIIIITCKNSYQEILPQMFGNCLSDCWNGHKQQVKIVETVKLLHRSKHDPS